MRALTSIGILIVALAACTDEPAPSPSSPNTMTRPTPTAPTSMAAPRAPDVHPPEPIVAQAVVAVPTAAETDCVPRDEICNGVDDDCDGMVDDGFAVGEVCTAGQGACAADGVIACAADGGAICTADAGEATFERCNGVDDDCDGATDESGDTATGNACGGCGPAPLETCNGEDDDCDGEIDEGFRVGAACTAGPGPLCAIEGVTQCTAAGESACDVDLTAIAACTREQSGRLAVAKAATCTVVNGDVRCWGAGALVDHRDAVLPPAAIEALELGAPAASVHVGDAHGCIIDHMKQVRCWGAGARGALGAPVDGTRAPRGEAQPVLPLDMDLASLALGPQRGCAVGRDGQVKCWGANPNGALGHAQRDDIGDAPAELDSLVPIALDMNVAQIVVGDRHTCALGRHGRVLCWGENEVGQLGLGDRAPRPQTTLATLPHVDLDARIIELAAAGEHTCALDLLGQVRCWGSNATGGLNGAADTLGGAPDEMGAALPIIPLPEPAVSIAASTGENCAVGVSGRLWCWGRAQVPAVRVHPVEAVDLGEPVVRISASANATCAVTGAGALKCWGTNDAGQLGQGDDFDRTAGRDIPAIALD